jgi:hypothetical protein
VILFGGVCKKHVTIITNNEKTVLIRSNIKDHQHDEDNDKQKKELQKIRKAIKRKAIENVYEKPIKIIRKELSSIEDSQVCSFNINALRKSMYRERRKTVPTVLSSITDAIQKVKIACIDLCGIVLFLCAVLGYAFCAVLGHVCAVKESAEILICM